MMLIAGLSLIVIYFIGLIIYQSSRWKNWYNHSLGWLDGKCGCGGRIHKVRKSEMRSGKSWDCYVCDKCGKEMIV